MKRKRSITFTVFHQIVLYIGDVFKEMWRITELNIEYDEEEEEEGENEDDEDEMMVSVSLLSLENVYMYQKKINQQCALIYKDKDLKVKKI